jgi:membrane protease YdiL (CAAX protease family)
VDVEQRVENKMNHSHSLEQHSIGTSILLHLLPGLLIGGGYFALLPMIRGLGYPSAMALMLAILLILLPLELGYLLYLGKKKSGRFSLDGIVMYRVPIPTWEYFLWVPGLFLLLGLIFTALKPVDVFLQQNLFAWIPIIESGLTDGFSKEALVLTYAMVAIFGALVGPVVEELYFRGYLLPRMGYAGKWAPLLHSFLFGLYHIWTPWMFLTRTIGMLPLAYAVRWRNLNLAIIVHIFVNALDVVAAVSFIAGLSSHG